MDLSKKHVRFIDNGLFHSFCRKVAPAFGVAEYWSPWAEQFPKSNRTWLGAGFPELERIQYVLKDADDVDLWVFLDVFHADLQVHLAKEGRRVWGARFGEELELERWDFKKFCHTKGILTPPAALVTGTKALREYLEDRENVYVKLAHGDARGDMETRKWKNKHVSEPWLDQVEYDLGAFKEDNEFIVEEEVEDSVEPGEDLFIIDGKYPSLCMLADEVKGLGLVGTVKEYGHMPEPMRELNAKLAPTFEQYQYRGFFSLESLFDKDQRFLVTDPCCRLGSPSNELLQELFGGWPEILWHGAEGVMAEPTQIAKFGFVVMVYSEQSGKNWLPLDYPKEIDQWVKLRNPYALNGKRYAVPQGQPTNIAGVVGIGDTLLEAAQSASEHAAQVNGNQIEISMDAIDKAIEIIEKGESYGTHFTEEHLPTTEELAEVKADSA